MPMNMNDLHWMPDGHRLLQRKRTTKEPQLKERSGEDVDDMIQVQLEEVVGGSIEQG